MILRFFKITFSQFILGVLTLCFSISAFSQKKDTNIKSNAVKCQIVFAGKYSGGANSRKVPLVSIQEILADPVVRTAGCDNYTITSFQLTIATVDGKAYVLASSDNHLTDQMLNLIQQVKKGNPIIIQAVHYKLPNGQTGIMAGINLRLAK